MVAQTKRRHGWHLYAGAHSRNFLFPHARRQAMVDRRKKPLWRWPCLLAATLLAFIATAGCTRQESTFAGTWKTRCANYWGLQIRPVGNSFYAVTFCGLSGCLEHAQWTPDTRIEGDPMYEVISEKELRVRRKDGGFFTYTRCSSTTEWPIGPGRTAEGENSGVVALRRSDTQVPAKGAAPVARLW